MASPLIRVLGTSCPCIRTDGVSIESELLSHSPKQKAEPKVGYRHSEQASTGFDGHRWRRKAMEPEIQQKVEETVLDILRSSNMEETTEYKVRKAASDRLGLDLSQPNRKQFVRQVVEAFLEDQQSKNQPEPEEEKLAEEGEDEEEEEVGGKRKGTVVKEYDDEGNRIICKLSERRKVTIQDFRGKTLVSIREYYRKDGKELPTSKGISLTSEQWSSFKKNVPAIEKAISKMESRLY